MPVAIPFTPPHVSINRVQIMDLPGVAMDAEVRGRKAYDLLSSVALVQYAREHAQALGLPSLPADAYSSAEARMKVSRLAAECLTSADPVARAAAQAIGRRLGRNLAHILLALHRGDPINRDARPDWTDGDWERWAAIRWVWLGGGLAQGSLGALIVEHARACLQELHGREAIRLACSPFPQEMALLGAARYLPAGGRGALVLDCGHTLVKRAFVTLENGQLAGERHFSPILVPLTHLGNPTPQPGPERGRQVLNLVVEAIARTWAEAKAEGLGPGPEVMLSVAAYVEDGRLLGNGLYANISALERDTRPLLSAAASQRIGKAVRVHPIHDGTAAAALHAGTPEAAVILVGTALGVGFPPATENDLRPLAQSLKM